MDQPLHAILLAQCQLSLGRVWSISTKPAQHEIKIGLGNFSVTPIHLVIGRRIDPQPNGKLVLDKRIGRGIGARRDQQKHQPHQTSGQTPGCNRSLKSPVKKNHEVKPSDNIVHFVPSTVSTPWEPKQACELLPKPCRLVCRIDCPTKGPLPFDHIRFGTTIRLRPVDPTARNSPHHGNYRFQTRLKIPQAPAIAQRFNLCVVPPNCLVTPVVTGP